MNFQKWELFYGSPGIAANFQIKRLNFFDELGRTHILSSKVINKQQNKQMVLSGIPCAVIHLNETFKFWESF